MKKRTNSVNSNVDFDDNYAIHQIYSIPSIALDQEKQLWKQLKKSQKSLYLISMSSLFIVRNLLELFRETILTGKVSNKKFNIRNMGSEKKILTRLPEISEELEILAAEMAEKRGPAKARLAEIAEQGTELIQMAEVQFEYLLRLGKEFVKSVESTGTVKKKIQSLADKISAEQEDYYKRRNDLIEPLLKYVDSISKKYRRRGLDRMEIIDIGTEGLIKAAEKFDPERGTKFSTYAYNWIHQKIGRELNNTKQISIPEGICHRYLKIQSAIEKIEGQFGRTPRDFGEIAAYCGMSKRVVKNTLWSFPQIDVDIDVYQE